MKYNTRLIWDYINGEEVKNIDELESDYKFMLEVLRITNDKNMYNLCSEEMKNNYEFIKSVIEIFIKDKQFVIQIIDEYLQKHNPDEIDYQELIFLVCDITDNINKDIDYDLLKYNLKRTMIYMKERANIEWNLNQEDYKTQQELGMGFAYLLYELYPNSPIILRHFAKRYIDEIFYNQEDLTLEELVHKHFSSFEKLQEIGIKKYILNYIGYKDNYLASYLLSNIDLIERLEQSIISIGTNWDNYTKRHNKQKILQFEEEAEELINKYHPSFNLPEAYYYLDNKNLNLPIKLCEDHYIKEYIEEIKKHQGDKSANINDYKYLKELTKLATEIFILSNQDGKIENKPFPIIPTVKKEPQKEIIIKLNRTKRKNNKI